MSIVHLDTHVVVWLHEANLAKLEPARRHLEGREIVLSPVAFLELQYLYEIGRTTKGASEIIASLSETVGLSIASTPWRDVVHTAIAFGWTRDPFDRLIAAHALTDGVPLVTADERLRAHCSNAVWG